MCKTVDWELGYRVFERIPSPTKYIGEQREVTGQLGYFAMLSDSTNDGLRLPTFRIIVDSVRIHDIQRVEFTAEEYRDSCHHSME